MSYFFQPSLFSYEEFIDEYDDNVRLVMVLSVLGKHFEPLIAKLERERMGRRDSYPVRVMMNSLLASYVYQIPVKNELIRELSRNGSLRRIVGIGSMAGVPKPWQYSRFIGKLAQDDNLSLMDAAFEACVDEIGGYIKGFGRYLSIDGTAVSSYSSGAKDKRTGLASDHEAAWGIREKRSKGKDGKVHKVVKKWFGYLVSLVVDCESELPVAYDVSPANASETKKLPEMFGHIKERHKNISPEAVMADAGYDSAKNCAYVLGELDAL